MTYVLEAFELESSPGTFVTSFTLSSFLIDSGDSIFASYEYENENFELLSIMTNSTVLIIQPTIEPVLTPKSFSLSVTDANGKKTSSVTSGDTISIIVYG